MSDDRQIKLQRSSLSLKDGIRAASIRKFSATTPAHLLSGCKDPHLHETEHFLILAQMETKPALALITPTIPASSLDRRFK
jgi:hypothetical protein